MSRGAPNPQVLSRLYLEAVLPCLADLSREDPAARAILGEARGSIALRVLGGPGAVVSLGQGRIAWAGRPALEAGPQLGSLRRRTAGEGVQIRIGENESHLRRVPGPERHQRQPRGLDQFRW